MLPPHQSPSRNSWTKSEPSSELGEDVSDAEYRVIWLKIALIMWEEQQTQALARPLWATPLQLQPRPPLQHHWAWNSQRPNKSAQSKKAWTMKNVAHTLNKQEGQGFLQCQVLKVTESIKVANMYSTKMNSMTIPDCVYMWHELTTIVMLQLGVCLDLRFLRVALVLGFLLLPPATQMCGKGVFWVMKGIDCDWRCGGALQVDSVFTVDREVQCLCCYWRGWDWEVKWLMQLLRFASEGKIVTRTQT